MIPMKDMLGIIATEAAEASLLAALESPTRAESDLPVLHYNLELIRLPDGRLEWAE